MRQSIINITNELANGQGLDFDIMDALKAIYDYNINAGTLSTPRRHNYEILNGCLFINGAIIKRVAPLPRKVANNESALYAEGRILARQEAFYND